MARLTVPSTILILGAGFLAAQTLDLPTSKQLIEPVPGHPQRVNSLPVSMAVSPDSRYVVTVNAGFGTYESKYDQSLAVLLAPWSELIRRFTPGWPSAAMAAASMPLSALSPIPAATARATPATPSWSTASLREESRRND
jgi:hypothetical protein